MYRLIILLIAIVVSASVQPAQAQIYSLNEPLPEFCFISEDQIDIDTICLPIMRDITPPDPIEERKLALPCSQSANPGGASCSCEVLRIFYRDIVIEKERAAANYQVNAPLLSSYQASYLEGMRLVSYYEGILSEGRFGEAQIVSARRLLSTARWYFFVLYAWFEDFQHPLFVPSDALLSQSEAKLALAHRLMRMTPCPVNVVLELLELAMRDLTLFIRVLNGYYMVLVGLHNALARGAAHINQIPAVLRAR